MDVPPTMFDLPFLKSVSSFAPSWQSIALNTSIATSKAPSSVKVRVRRSAKSIGSKFSTLPLRIFGSCLRSQSLCLNHFSLVIPKSLRTPINVSPTVFGIFLCQTAIYTCFSEIKIRVFYYMLPIFSSLTVFSSRYATSSHRITS